MINELMNKEEVILGVDKRFRLVNKSKMLFSYELVILKSVAFKIISGTICTSSNYTYLQIIEFSN